MGAIIETDGVGETDARSPGRGSGEPDLAPMDELSEGDVRGETPEQTNAPKEEDEGEGETEKPEGDKPGEERQGKGRRVHAPPPVLSSGEVEAPAPEQPEAPEEGFIMRSMRSVTDATVGEVARFLDAARDADLGDAAIDAARAVMEAPIEVARSLDGTRDADRDAGIPAIDATRAVGDVAIGAARDVGIEAEVAARTAERDVMSAAGAVEDAPGEVARFLDAARDADRDGRARRIMEEQVESRGETQ